MTDQELERLHLLATVGTYGPADSAFLRERANDEAAHDAFDPLPDIEPRAIGAKLSALRARGWLSFEGDCWVLTGEGRGAMEAGLAELDGVVVPDEEITADEVRRATDVLRDECGSWFPEDSRAALFDWEAAARNALTAAREVTR
jgi:hypothetical protein